MKISPWIYFPVFFILIYGLPQILFNRYVSAGWLLYYTIFGTIIGFTALYESRVKARRIAAGKNDPEVYQVKQKRTLTVLLGYEKAFALCLEAVEHLNPAKIKTKDLTQGIIQCRTRFTIGVAGHLITIKLHRINECLTEIAISTQPSIKIQLVSAGHSWKYVEEICKFLKEKDAEINRKILVESAAILDYVYVKPFQKEKVQR